MGGRIEVTHEQCPFCRQWIIRGDPKINWRVHERPDGYPCWKALRQAQKMKRKP